MKSHVFSVKVPGEKSTCFSVIGQWFSSFAEFFPTAHSHWTWNFWTMEKWLNLFFFYSFERQQPWLAELPCGASDLDRQKSSWTEATFNGSHKKAEHTRNMNNQDLCGGHVGLVVHRVMTSQEQAKTGTSLRTKRSTAEHGVQTNKTTTVRAHTSLTAVVLQQFQIVWRSLKNLAHKHRYKSTSRHCSLYFSHLRMAI